MKRYLLPSLLIAAVVSVAYAYDAFLDNAKVNKELQMLSGSQFINEDGNDINDQLNSLDSFTAAELGVLDGVTAGTVTASKAVVVDASKDIGSFRNVTATGTVDVPTVSNATLILESLNAATLKLNDTDALQLDNAAISGFAAAADTAGNGVYVETEDGGTDGGTASTGQAGGALAVKTGDGSAAVTTDAVGGAGGAITHTGGAGAAGDGSGNGGAGGANSNTAGAGGGADTGTGGAGGAATVASGAGGATTGAAGTGGAGGAVNLTAGNGGNDGEGGSGTGGAGGSITLTPGEGGTGATVGANGAVVVADGIFRFARQTLDMSDAAVQLVLSDAGAGEAELKANVLRCDPNSAGAGEDLELPPEADCDGMLLLIYNFGGENIVVKDDSGGTTIDTIATTEMGIFFCDGTLWSGQNES